MIKNSKYKKLPFKIFTTPKSVLNISLTSSFKILQIDKFPEPPFPISFSILKSNPKFNNKNIGTFSKSNNWLINYFSKCNEKEIFFCT